MTRQPLRVDARAKDLLVAALERSASERSQFLAQECAGEPGLREAVLGLLRAHELAEGTFEAERAGVALEQPGDRIGHCKLLQKIGEGGFGVVWMAEQEEPVRRKVALKVLKAGMDTAQVVGRFEAERQALAMMDHEHIAKVFDGGATAGGRPYFVMELVKGVPITQYCDEAGLSMVQRLELFLPVCGAVQHAHQKGVIHRDLKPSNVLVTLHDGKAVPKVIDFGIAKATTGTLTQRTVFTEFRQMLGTPEYMAPEQAELSSLDVDTRADVYSLGVLLYELLTGTRPFELKTLLQAGYEAMLKTIREVDPPKPSTRVSTLGEQVLTIARQRQVHPKSFGSLFRGDLDWIVMRALEKERSRRYETVSALAEDIRRHLEHEPVLAGPPSRLYRLRKYVRRNRVAVTAGTLIAVALVVGGAASALGWLEAQAQAKIASQAEKKAKAEAATSRRVIGLLEKVLTSSDPYEMKGRDYTVRQLLDDLERELGDALAKEPAVELALRNVIGKTLYNLELPERALVQFQRARDLLAMSGNDGSRVMAHVWLNIAELERGAGRRQEALQACRAGLAVLPSMPAGPEQAGCRCRLLLQLASLQRAADQTDEATVSLEAARLAAEDAGHDMLALLSDVGKLECDLAYYDRAEEHLRQAYAIASHTLPPGHRRRVAITEVLVTVLGQRGRNAEAERLSREAVESLRPELEPAGLAIMRSAWGMALAKQGRLDEAEVQVREALRLATSQAGRLDPTPIKFDLGCILFGLGRHEEAEALAREMLAASGRGHEASLYTCRPLQLLANICQARNHAAQAVGLFQQVFQVRSNLLAAGNEDLENSRGFLGKALASTGRHQEAEALFRSGLREMEANGNGGGFGHAITRGLLANLLLEMPGREQEAASELRSAMAEFEQLGRADDYEALDCVRKQAIQLRVLGRPAESVPLFRRVVTTYERWIADGIYTQGAMRREQAGAMALLGQELEALREVQEAQHWLRRALAVFHMAPNDGVDKTFVTMVRGWLCTLLARDGQCDDIPAQARQGLGELAGSDDGDPSVWEARMVLVTALNHCGCWPEVEAELRDRLSEARKRWGADALELATGLLIYGRALNGLGRHAEAEVLLREGLAIRARKQRSSFSHYNAMSLLGEALLDQGKIDEAAPWIQEAAEGMAQDWRIEHHRRSALQRAVDLCRAQGNAQGAAAWQAKLDAVRTGTPRK